VRKPARSDKVLALV